jgi:hypothetical protein
LRRDIGRVCQKKLYIHVRGKPKLVAIVEEDQPRTAISGGGAKATSELHLAYGRLDLRVTGRDDVGRVGLVRAVRVNDPETRVRQRNPKAVKALAARLGAPIRGSSAGCGNGGEQSEEDCKSKVKHLEPFFGRDVCLRARNLGQDVSWSKVSFPSGVPRWGTGP